MSSYLLSSRDCRDILRINFVFLLSLISLGLSACISTEEVVLKEPAVMPVLDETSEGDPIIGVNKKIFSFNDGLDRYLMEPVAKGYEAVMPRPFSRGITNFFSNLGEPRVILNDILQGKIGQSISDSMRFLINSTVGLAGLFDVAGRMGMKPHREDFGQTLAVWGYKRSSYFVIPLLGPSNVRDTIGEIIDFFTYPLIFYPDVGARNSLYVLRFVDTRANLLDVTDIVREAAGDDRYEFVREAYRQRRAGQIHDGNPPLELPYLIDEDTKVPADTQPRRPEEPVMD